MALLSNIYGIITCKYHVVFLSLQYYEMSYGLNVEMHKQVGFVLVYLCVSYFVPGW